jgi:hypothetical protein
VPLAVESFENEILAALKAYDRHVVCLEKTPDEAERSLRRLVEKAVRAYETRGAGLRHGIALDRHLTIILSENDGQRPLCGIYFNLHSPLRQKAGCGL